MSGQYRSRVLHGEDPLDEGLEKIPDLAQDTQHERENKDLDRCPFRNQKLSTEVPPDDASRYVAKAALRRLSRTDFRREFFRSKLGTDKIRHCITEHDYQKNKKDPSTTVGHTK